MLLDPFLLRKREDQEKWKGMFGAVADILEPDPRYEIPLKAVLGERLQYLIVEGEKEGMEAMSFLKGESLGRGSFIPKWVHGIGVENRISPEEGRPVPLLRFVKVKEGFHSVAEFLIGDVGLVESWEEALHWMKRAGEFGALVSREGDVLERSGVMSGGSRYPSEAVQQRAEEEAQALFPQFKDVFKAIIMGPLGRVSEPDVFIILANADQIHRLTRAYCYATGSFIKGYAGMGACRMLLPNAFIHKEPAFTVSDRAWRRALKLLPDELTLVTPPDKLITMLESLEASNQ